jgi:hypothetical protein
MPGDKHTDKDTAEGTDHSACGNQSGSVEAFTRMIALVNRKAKQPAKGSPDHGSVSDGTGSVAIGAHDSSRSAAHRAVGSQRVS